jgi:hypothetical protein
MRRMPRATWRWFASWHVVGVCLAGVLAAAFAGLLLLPVAVAAAVLLARGERVGGIPGAVSGLGLPLVLVAYLNRHGPGEHCTAVRGGRRCVDELAPLPWLLAGLTLIAAGWIWFAWSRRAGSR